MGNFEIVKFKKALCWTPKMRLDGIPPYHFLDISESWDV